MCIRDSRKDIQVLRGIAVFSVVLFHFSPGTFINGYLGVDIFFVISGFLISNIILIVVSYFYWPLLI